MTYRMAVDIGGTFTDVVVEASHGGSRRIYKLPSSPQDPAAALLDGLEQLLQELAAGPDRLEVLLHGTTVATNAVLEGRGARTALVTTAGFEDVLAIGRQVRPALYDLTRRWPPPLVPRWRRFGVAERLDAAGQPLRTPARPELDRLATALYRARAESAAIVTLHSYRNPVHERLIARHLARRLPHLSLSLSAELLPEFREFERTSTTVVNAYIQPVVAAYLESLTRGLEAAGFGGRCFVMQSNGGCVTPAEAARESVRTLLSGPAGGVLAGCHAARETGGQLITLDMGGTSTDISVVRDGALDYSEEGRVAGYPVRLPMLAIETIGAGGGSVAQRDPGGNMQVGPASAGAHPGPACYGRGGRQPTVTDANLIAGRLGPEPLLGGRLTLQPAAAEAALAGLGRELGLSILATATGILRVAEAQMARGIRLVTVERGYDPQAFALMAFGGAGPLHASALARMLEIPEVIVPRHPGIGSAVGILEADLRYDLLATLLAPWSSLTAAGLADRQGELRQRAAHRLADAGIPPDRQRFSTMARVRFSGQAFYLEVPLEVDNGAGESVWERLESAFHARHRERFGYTRAGDTLELVGLRLTGVGLLPRRRPPAATLRQGSPPARGRTRLYLADGSELEAALLAREDLLPGHRFSGPAVVTQPDATTFVHPEQQARVDAAGRLRLRWQEAAS